MIKTPRGVCEAASVRPPSFRRPRYKAAAVASAFSSGDGNLNDLAAILEIVPRSHSPRRFYHSQRFSKTMSKFNKNDVSGTRRKNSDLLEGLHAVERDFFPFKIGVLLRKLLVPLLRLLSLRPGAQHEF